VGSDGLNNKAKVTMRKSYGFRTYRILEPALYRALGKLPSRKQPTISSDESKLETQPGTIDVIVIDRAGKASAN
jgi:hypothetical protein